MILSKTAKVKLWARNMQHLLDLGYIGNKGDIIDVNIEHLSDGCYSEIEVACDICGNQRMLKYKDYNKSVKNMGYYACPKCAPKKIEDVNLKRYGVKSASQIDTVKEKIKSTLVERYGVDNAAKSEKIKEKARLTNLERYGVLYPSQSPEVRAKVNESFYKNGTQKTSKQQLYLCNLYGGKLNYPTKYYSADICFPEENLIIEYDGSGHELNVKFGRITKEEQLQKEITRFSILRREGYKQMRIISLHDKIPSDNVLFEMLAIAKKYFDTTSHSWINFDIDNSIIINAENKKDGGAHFDYGELHIIKDVL
jgi:very-short-patch-repair endonuclease